MYVFQQVMMFRQVHQVFLQVMMFHYLYVFLEVDMHVFQVMMFQPVVFQQMYQVFRLLTHPSLCQEHIPAIQ